MFKDILKKTYLSLRSIVLFLLELLLSLKTKPLSIYNSPERIIFIRIDRLGDLVLCTPAFKAIKNRFPNANLTVLCSVLASPILKHNPWIDNIQTYNKSNGLAEILKIIKTLSRQSYDIAIDTHAGYELLPALFTFFSSDKMRIGYSSFGKGAFFNVKLTPPSNDKHFVDIALDTLRPLEISPEDKAPNIFLNDEEKVWAVNWLNKKGIINNRLIGLHPGAHFETQRWPTQYFAELIGLIKKEYEGDIIIFGSYSEKEPINDILSDTDISVFSFISDDLRKFPALLSRCNLLICNNSGPLHVAEALSIPTVSTMGPTIKERWMPLGDIHKILRMDNLKCIGCNLGYCKIKTHDCMRMITPSIVFEKISYLI